MIPVYGVENIIINHVYYACITGIYAIAGLHPSGGGDPEGRILVFSEARAEMAMEILGMYASDDGM